MNFASRRFVGILGTRELITFKVLVESESEVFIIDTMWWPRVYGDGWHWLVLKFELCVKLYNEERRNESCFIK